MAWSVNDLSAYIQEEGKPPKYLWQMATGDEDVFPFDPGEDIQPPATAALIHHESGEVLTYEPAVSHDANVALVTVDGETAGWTTGEIYTLKVTFRNLAGNRSFSRTLALWPVI